MTWTGGSVEKPRAVKVNAQPVAPDYWPWPWPRAGELMAVCDGPKEGIGPTTHDLDGRLCREAARPGRRVWTRSTCAQQFGRHHV